MAEYIIEIRLAGYAREYLRGIVYAAARRFNIKGVNRKSVAPPIRLLGPLRGTDERSIMKALIDAAGKHRVVAYKIRGFNHCRGQKRWLLFNQEMNTIYLDIEPSRELIQIRRDLESSLAPLFQDIQEVPPTDDRFYVNLPLGDLGSKFERVWSYLKEREDPNIIQRLIRIIVLKNGRVMCEYDLLENKLSVREISMGNHYMEKTLNFLTQNTTGLQLMVKRRRPRTSRQTTLTGEERRLWLARIVSPILHEMHRNPSNWMPKVITPLITMKHEPYKQVTLPTDEPLPKSQPKMQPLFPQQTKRSFRQTTLVPQPVRPWIAGIILPAIGKGRR